MKVNENGLLTIGAFVLMLGAVFIVIAIVEGNNTACLISVWLPLTLVFSASGPILILEGMLKVKQ